MLINLTYKGMPAYAFAIYNFAQVKDAVLLVMSDKRQEKFTMLFTCTNNNWQLDEDLGFLNAETFLQINQALENISKSVFKTYYLDAESDSKNIVNADNIFVEI